MSRVRELILPQIFSMSRVKEILYHKSFQCQELISTILQIFSMSRVKELILPQMISMSSDKDINHKSSQCHELKRHCHKFSHCQKLKRYFPHIVQCTVHCTYSFYKE